MPDLSGRTVIVTGANSGLGFEASRALATRGARVVMACRSTERGAEAADRIRGSVPAASLAVLELDLADLRSVRRFASIVREWYDAIDLLVNNAGVMAIPRSETTDGFETQFGVNHLGHFALTGLLFDRLAAADARVVTQSSALHERGRIDFDDLHGERDYDPWDAYGQSKLANLLFAYELQRRLDEAGPHGVRSVACHPGWAATNLQARGPEARDDWLRLAVVRLANALFAQDAADGVLPMLYAATEDVAGGSYVGPGGFRSMRGPPEVQRSSDRSYDRDTARRLWTVSEELTGVEYDFETLAAAAA
jgi:NAD(P)-dependent dehydrogenase (short-subunit alcohol dehydrogenase family)